MVLLVESTARRVTALFSSGRGRRIHHTLNYLTPISSAGERGLTRCNLVTEPAPLVVPYLWATRNLGAVC